MEETMRAFYIDKEKCYLQEKEQDMTLENEEVLLKIKYVGLCGSDLNTYRKLNPLVTYPRIPGHEISAEIVAKGNQVPDYWLIDDNVCVIPYTNCGKCSSCQVGRYNCCQHNQTLGVQQDGSMQDFFKIHFSKLLKFPDISQTELALVEPLSVGYHAIIRGGVQKDKYVAIIGCGMIGIGAIFGAILAGSKVIAIDIDDQKLELMKQYGVSYTINSKKENIKEAIDLITDKHGVSLVIEAVGNPATYTQAIDIVSFAGRVVYIGYAKEPVSYETKYFVMKELDILGSRNAFVEDFQAVGQYLSEKRFDITPLISKIYPINQTEQALNFWDKTPNSIIKILISTE